MDCSASDLPVHHQLSEFTQIHVHWVGDSIQPSHPLSSPSPPALHLSQLQSLFFTYLMVLLYHPWILSWPFELPCCSVAFWHSSFLRTCLVELVTLEANWEERNGDSALWPCVFTCEWGNCFPFLGHTCSLADLEMWSQKSRGRQGPALSEGSQGQPVVGLFQLLVVVASLDLLATSPSLWSSPALASLLQDYLLGHLGPTWII